MTEAAVTDEVIRQFLLGDLEDRSRQRVEEVFISDPNTRDRVLMTENDLIEDYLEDSLSPLEREKFVSHYLATPRQRRKLRIATSLREYVIAEAVAGKPLAREETLATPKWRSYFQGLKAPNRFLFVPLAAVLTLAIVFGAIWLMQRHRLSARIAQENSRRLTIERELVAANHPVDREQPANQIVSLVLPPVSVRTFSPSTKLPSIANAAIVELWLLWDEKEAFPGYRAVLQRVGSTEQFTIPDLRVETGPDGRAIRLKIPAHILTPGDYQVGVSGVAADGKPAPPTEFSFRVNG
jgi:hypothetical protein